MELVARKADLVRELQFFQQIVERKNTIPILANVLLESSGNELTLLATDPVALRSRCEADGQSRAVMPAKKFYEIVRALPEADVKLEICWRSGVRCPRNGSNRACRPCRGRGFSSLSEGGRAERSSPRARRCADGRQDAVRDHRRRHAVLPEWRAFVLRGDSMTVTDGIALRSSMRRDPPSRTLTR